MDFLGKSQALHHRSCAMQIAKSFLLVGCKSTGAIAPATACIKSGSTNRTIQYTRKKHHGPGPKAL